jgi:potassium efflux system protein
LTTESASVQLAETKTTLESLAKDAEPDSPEARRRAALQRRVTLLEEYLTLAEAAAGFAGRGPELQGRLEEAQAALGRTLEETPLPEVVSPEEFKVLGEALGVKRDAVAELKSALAESQQRSEAIPERITDAQARATEAQERGSRQAEEANAASDSTEKAILELWRDNARIERQVAHQQAKTLEAEQRFRKELAPVLSAEVQVAERELQHLDAEHARYSDALGAELARQEEEMEGLLEQKKEEAAAARTPAQQFEAAWGFLATESQASKGRLETLKVNLARDVEEQTRRRDNDREELASLRDYLDRSAGAPQAVERIKQTFRQIDQRKALLDRATGTSGVAAIDSLRGRRFEVEDLLFDLEDRFQSEQAAVLETFSADQQDAFTEATSGLLDSCRSELAAEKALLTDVIGRASQLLVIYREREEVLAELERFIRSAVFWLRDEESLGRQVFASAGAELRAVGAWSHDLFSAETGAALLAPFQRPMGVMGVLIMLVALPAAGFHIWRRLGRFMRERNARAAEHSPTVGSRSQVITAAVVRALLPWGYFILAAWIVYRAGFPEDVGPVIGGALRQLAHFTLFLTLARSFLRGNGIAVAQLDLDKMAARSLYRALFVILIGDITVLLAWRVLYFPPLSHLALARLFYTLFAILAGVAVAWVLRPRSPLVRRGLLAGSSGIVARHWGLLSAAITLTIAAIIVLDALGFRYGASRMAGSLALSLATVVLLMGLHGRVQKALASAVVRKRAAAAREDAEDPGYEEERWRGVLNLERIQRIAKVALIFVGLLLVATYWGADREAFQTLQEIEIYRIRGGEANEYVTAADLLRALLYLVVMVWLLRVLPGIYDYAIFPRFKLDEGLKYAILTISRYTAVAVGIVIVLAQLHLDLGRLGWLMAALGVGLGFGLQEIVSNFVCGIILLVERPVRVGDTVTVGSVSGTVTRINIRATSIRNFDNREVLLPNRSLITSEVTNWTRGNTVNRLVISIGVAYGSDVDKVSELLLELARAQPEVLEDPEPSVIFMSHGESSLDFELRVFVPSPAEILPLRDRLNKMINRTFAEQGIEIPFPQRDLNIKAMPVKVPEVTTIAREPKSPPKRERKAGSAVSGRSAPG